MASWVRIPPIISFEDITVCKWSKHVLKFMVSWFKRKCSLVVELSTADRMVPSSNPGSSFIPALLAQSVEHQTFNLRATGSSPVQGCIDFLQQYLRLSSDF